MDVTAAFQVAFAVPFGVGLSLWALKVLFGVDLIAALRGKNWHEE